MIAPAAPPTRATTDEAVSDDDPAMTMVRCSQNFQPAMSREPPSGHNGQINVLNNYHFSLDHPTIGSVQCAPAGLIAQPPSQGFSSRLSSSLDFFGGWSPAPLTPIFSLLPLGPVDVVVCRIRDAKGTNKPVSCIAHGKMAGAFRSCSRDGRLMAGVMAPSIELLSNGWARSVFLGGRVLGRADAWGKKPSAPAIDGWPRNNSLVAAPPCSGPGVCRNARYRS
ncbi:hypothetical protein B0T24DRAFT_350979 [Lasiosphaeria ovina]|uniref:Uncharacterized protein n=1 Tax=Lasiosphaeria ovina TaxID=92902 RepID=A0AAE0K2R3_9PEZI|nr:hypothetical protein B0T24DRAFT_350979 [Lasiosphaeria ovina]